MTRASGVRSLADAHSSVDTTTAPAPSLTPGLLPAVCEPSGLSGGSLARVSRLLSRRGASSTSTTFSPFLDLTVTATISSGRRPSSVASIARWWERRAQRSMSGRVSSSSEATSEASSNICRP